MGLFSKDIKTMNDLFLHTLQDVYYAEQQIVKALPDMVEKASDAQLKQDFQTHLRETEMHVKRLECQTASKFDPRLASNFDPLWRRVLAVALALSELVGVAEAARARVGV